MTWQETYLHWTSDAFDQTTREELEGLSPEEARERFDGELSFGTGGMRALMGAGTCRMNRYTVRKASRGVAQWLTSRGAAAMGVAIAYDSRLHSREFAIEAACTLCGGGIHAYLFPDPAPTPLLSFVVKRQDLGAGIVITASHNPKEYNGLKVYDGDGCQLVPALALELTEFISAAGDPASIPVPTFEEAFKKGLLTQTEPEITAAFCTAVASYAKSGLVPPKGFRLVYTPLHGTGGMTVPAVLHSAGYVLDSVSEQALPDGGFPTVRSPNPEDRRALGLAVARARETGAQLVLGTDPDCDRLGAAILHHGQYVLLSGNQLGALLTQHLISRYPERLNSDWILIKTLVTGELGAAIARRHGVQVMETPTGFKYIGDQIRSMRKDPDKHFLFGYEESFGFLVGPYILDKDGAGAALLTAEMCALHYAQGRTLADELHRLYLEYGFYLDHQSSVALSGSEGCAAIDSAMARLRHMQASVVGGICLVKDYHKGIDGYQPLDMMKFFLTDGSWFAVRPSGTEPKLKFYFSIKDEDEPRARRKLAALTKSLSESLSLPMEGESV